MTFIGRWVGNAVNIAFALVFAMLAMQAPAFTRDYAEALLQVAQDARRDIEQREASARRFYPITAGSDEQVIAALKPLEPSNAETLALSVDRARSLGAAYEKIARTHPLLQPVVAMGDAVADEHGYKAAVWRTLLGTYTPHLDFSLAAGAYGLAGLLLGSLAAQLLTALGRGLLGRGLARQG
jgi:nucleotide-binding universal stress UspA family protein